MDFADLEAAAALPPVRAVRMVDPDE